MNNPVLLHCSNINADFPLPSNSVNFQKYQMRNLSFSQSFFSPVGRFEDFKPAN